MSGLSLGVREVVRRFPRSGFRLEIDEFDIPAGTVQALLGPSGSGKSTLLTILGLLERPDTGSVLVDGRETSVRDRATKLRMAAVFQRPYLFKGSVAENVAYGLAVRGVPQPGRVEPVARVLEQVGLAGFGERSVSSLSGGEAQRVSLARALVLEPRVLLLDEPLASLDALLKRRLTTEFAEILRSSGATAVWVTHDQDEAMVVADRIAVLNQGRIVASGTCEEVVNVPEDAWTAHFLGLPEAASGIARDAGEGLVEIRSAALTVVATGRARDGQAVRFSVAPHDILLFEAEVDLPLTTARNRVEATVTSITPRGSTVMVELDCLGVRLAASVSRASVTELNLRSGSRVLAVFKATAVQWRAAD